MAPFGSGWLTSGLALVLIAVALRRLLPGVAPGGWRWRTDAILCLGLAVTVMIVGAEHFARYYQRDGPFGGNDFTAYCEAVVAAMNGQAVSMNPQRSRFVALIVAPLAARFGLMDGLILGTGLGVGAAVVGAYFWGHAVAGRGGAIAAAILVPCVGPLVVLTRFPNFYGEQVGGYLLASGLVAQAMVRRGAPWVLTAAAATAALPLLDVRGLVWFLVFAPLCCLAAMACRWRSPPKSRGLRVGLRMGCVAAVLAMFFGSWVVGPSVWPKGFAGTFESQVRMYAVDTWRHGVGGLDIPDAMAKVPVCGVGPGFSWGSSDPRSLPSGLACAAKLSASVAPSTADTERRWRDHGAPWIPVLGGAFAGLVVLQARRPVRLLAMILPALPAAAALMAAQDEVDVRRLAPGLLFAPVLLGAAWSLLTEGGGRPPHWAGRAIRAGCLVLIVLGVVPTWLSPVASWRVQTMGQVEWRKYTAGDKGQSRFDAACAEALQRDQVAGEPAAGHLGARWEREERARDKPDR